MSLQALVWAIEDAVGRDLKAADPDADVDVPAQCVAVLQGLANHADRDGRSAFPSVELLAHYARKSERSVQRDLSELERLGLIRRGDQRAAYFIPEQYRPTVWDLAVERRRRAFTPSRRRSASPLADVPRGDAGVTPDGGRGDVHDGGGVTPTSPEPTHSTGTTPVVYGSHVPRAASTASPPTRAGGHTPPPSPPVAADDSDNGTPPADLEPAAPPPPPGRGRAAWQQMREDLLARRLVPPPPPTRRPSGLPLTSGSAGG